MPQTLNRPWVRAASLVAGLALTAAAAWFALGRNWHTALAPLAHASPWSLAALAGAVLVQLLLTSILFWVITLSFDAQPPVPAPRMLQIIAASSLLGYLPMEAGLLGRTAYLKWRHNLPVRQSLIILLIVVSLSIVVPGAAVLLALTAGWGGGPTRIALALVLIALLSAVTRPIAQACLHRRVKAPWIWVPLRSAELLVGAARLWLAFQIVGAPQGFSTVLIAAAAAFFVSLLSPTPNGLGVREWVIAALAAALSPVTAQTGALASLVDRAVEAVVFTFAGAWAIERLHRAPPDPSAEAA